MQTSKQLTFDFGVGESMYSQEASPASPTASQANSSVQQTNATCGPKCLEQLERFPRVGLWAKTFAALLIGQEGWSSRRCKLTWKLQGTKYGRLYCQLAVSKHPTSGSEFGLLPTPKAREAPDCPSERNRNTPSLQALAAMDLLPTPTSRDHKGARSTEALEASGRNHNNTLPDFFAQTGKTSQLNPRFVAEMMGFPPYWME
jgi:hypothetical protein